MGVVLLLVVVLLEVLLEVLVLGAGVLTRGGRNETGAEVVLHGEVGRRRWPLRGRAHRFS
jgi:hypothetical protein